MFVFGVWFHNNIVIYHFVTQGVNTSRIIISITTSSFFVRKDEVVTNIKGKLPLMLVSVYKIVSVTNAHINILAFDIGCRYLHLIILYNSMMKSCTRKSRTMESRTMRSCTVELFLALPAYP